MKSFLVISALSLVFAVQSAMAASGTPSHPLPLIVEQRLNQSALTGPIVRLGTQVTQKKVNVLKAVYDFSILGGASGATGATGASHILKDSDGGDAVLPKNALIKSVMVRVVDTLVNSGAAVQCGIDANASDLVSHTAITTLNSGNRMTAGGIVQGTMSGWLKVPGYNQAVGCLFPSSGAGLSAGKFVLYIEYYIGAPNE